MKSPRRITTKYRSHVLPYNDIYIYDLGIIPKDFCNSGIVALSKKNQSRLMYRF